MPRYAQHFLVNRHAIERIVSNLNLTPTDAVLEIGPGKGALTAQLVGAAGKIIAVEIDPELIVRLTQRFSYTPKFHLIPGDILKVDFSAIEALHPNFSGERFKVVGNLPYNLTSPILRRLCDWDGWTEALVMVQKEVGDRMTARAGTPEYGALTVGMNLVCAMTPIFDLSEKSFDPPPKVRSTIVRLERRQQPLTDDIPFTQRVIQAAFQQRRKTIMNSLSHGLHMDKAAVKNALDTIGINDDTRAERIPVDQFIALAAQLKKSAIITDNI